MTTIALVDDDRHILTSVSMALQAEGYRTQTYSDSANALVGLRETPPDIAILDIMMPGMDGIELLRRLRKHSDLPVIFLSAKDDEIDELFGLKMGADDFIRKPFSQELLMERVKAVPYRTKRTNVATADNVDTSVIDRGKLQLDPERHACTWNTNPVTLTVREFLVLQALAQWPGTVKSRRILMDAIHGDQMHFDERNLDSYIQRLRTKFAAVDESFDAIETVYGVGYLFKET